MNLTLITDATQEPLDLAGLWAHLRQLSTDQQLDEEALVAEYLQAARVDLERRAGIVLLEQTWEAGLDAFPCWTSTTPRRAIILPRPPLRAVTWIHYTDLDGTTQTLDPTLYTVDTRRFPGQVLPAYGQVWPSTQDVPNAVIVRFTAGFGTNPEDVPAPIRDALRLEVANRYENREDTLVGEANVSPTVVGAIERLVANYRAYVV